MNKYSKSIAWLAAGLVWAACKTNGDHPKETADKQPTQAAVQAAASAPKFAGVQFASQKDTSCGMPLSAGVADTVVLDGKVYGFCSPECKGDFVTLLQKQHKR